MNKEAHILTIPSSGRKVVLDECDHDPSISFRENTKAATLDLCVGEVIRNRDYFYICTRCSKTVAPQVFVEHPCGFIATE